MALRTGVNHKIDSIQTKTSSKRSIPVNVLPEQNLLQNLNARPAYAGRKSIPPQAGAKKTAVLPIRKIVDMAAKTKHKPQGRKFNGIYDDESEDIGTGCVTPIQTRVREESTDITAFSQEETPTPPPMKMGDWKKASAAIIFVDTKNLPFTIINMDAKPVFKPRSDIRNPLSNEKCKGSRFDYKKAYSAKQLGLTDPDECFKNDPAMVTEYVEDIFSYLRSMEAKFPIRQNFLKDHETPSCMRASLIDWLVGVQEHLDLYLETLHLSVAILDRYLQDNKDVGPDTLQLVGIASLFVACKYEEMYVPDFEEFLHIYDDSFSKSQILTMEKDILRQLDYSFGRPLSVHFLRRYNRVAQVPSSHHSLGKFILELVLVEYNLSHVNPSLQAAAACCLSMGIMNGAPFVNLSSLWTPTLVYYTNYEYSEFKELIVSLADLLVNCRSSNFQRVRKKYASSSHGKISLHANLNGPLVRMLTTTKK